MAQFQKSNCKLIILEVGDYYLPMCACDDPNVTQSKTKRYFLPQNFRPTMSTRPDKEKGTESINHYYGNSLHYFLLIIIIGPKIGGIFLNLNFLNVGN